MKLNKIISALLCLGAFSMSGGVFADTQPLTDQSKEFVDLVSSSSTKTSNAQINVENVRDLIASKYPIIQKFKPDFKVEYLKSANIYEIDLGAQKAYTNEDVSYIYLRGQVFINKDGQMINLTTDPKEYIKKEINPSVSSLDSNQPEKAVEGSQATPQLPSSLTDVDKNQKTHSTLKNDPYLNSLSESVNVEQLKSAAMMEYIGSDGYSSMPDSAVDYVKDLNLSNAVKLVYGNGKRIMIAFSDPDCQYCQLFEHRLTQNADKLDVTVYVLPWALDIHKDAPQKINFIWSQKDPSEAWKSWMTFAYFNPELVNNNTAWDEWVKKTHRVQGEKSNPPIKETEEFVRKYGLRYTPTLVFPNGAAHEGDVTIEKLLSFLAVSEKKVNAQ